MRAQDLSSPSSTNNFSPEGINLSWRYSQYFLIEPRISIQELKKTCPVEEKLPINAAGKISAFIGIF